MLQIKGFNAENSVAGAKQVMRALARKSVKSVFIADDAPEHLTTPLKNECVKHNIPIYTIDTMKHLGEYAGIDVNAVAFALLL